MNSHSDSPTRFKIVIPRLTLTTVDDQSIDNDNQTTSYNDVLSSSYRVIPRTKLLNANVRTAGLSNWTPVTFDLYPIVLCGDGSLWSEANMWILSILQSKITTNMRTIDSVASDLAAYRQFLEEYRIDWLLFPSHKQNRPIHRFNGRLKYLIQNQEIASSTAKRRIATVIRFYRWLVEENGFKPQNPPWRESERYIEFKGGYGFSGYKKIQTTDLNISSSKELNPYEGYIDDGGKLRPLFPVEQEWLINALLHLGNTEITLIHIFGLVTGARIQSLLTMRVHHFDTLKDDDGSKFVRIPIGSGTDVDSKNSKKMVVWIPVWFYKILHIYAVSERSKKRRQKAIGGDCREQYLFLTTNGAPYYDASNTKFVSDKKIRHSKRGQGVRQYITDYILPHINQNYEKDFHYTFHDLRATFGMNLLEELLPSKQNDEYNLHEILDFIKVRMGHSSLSTTNHYLNYRKRQKLAKFAQSSWEDRLCVLANSALEKSHE